MDDPQLTGQVIVTGALLAWVRWPPARFPLVLAAAGALIVSGLFIKHNLVALPLALTLDLALSTPALLPWWLLAAGGGAALVGTALEWTSGRLMLANILTPRRYGVDGLIRLTSLAMVVMAGPLAATIRSIHRRHSSAGLRLVTLYFATSMLAGIVFSGGSGADLNMFFDAFVAVSIGFGLALTALDHRPEARGLLLFAVAGWLALATPLRLLTPTRYESLREREADTRTDVAFVRAAAGDAYCEQMLVCYEAGKPLVLQPYFAPELVAAGSVPVEAVEGLFAFRVFSVVQLDRPLNAQADDTGRPAQQRLPPSVLRVIDREYRLVRTSSNGAFYVRRVALPGQEGGGS
jgi:hypothetical protein